MNSGIAEQVQKGVTIPRSDANTLPEYFLSPANTFLTFSGGRNERIIETKNIITAKSSKILIVS